MVWIYFQESVVLHLPCVTMSTHLPIAKLINTARLFCYLGCIQENYLKLQYGMISRQSWDQYCPQSTSSMVVSRARILALQEMEKAWKASEADYFSRSYVWPKKSIQNSYSLKTSQQSQPEAAVESLEKLPKWGMIVDGVLYPLKALERYISARDGSCWLTPSTMEHLPVRTGEALERSKRRGTGHSIRKVSGRLNEQVAYPEMWPKNTILSQQSMIGKKLCPRWVSVLMGYLTTHTDLEPWAMQWFQSKQKKHLKS